MGFCEARGPDFVRLGAQFVRLSPPVRRAGIDTLSSWVEPSNVSRFDRYMRAVARFGTSRSTHRRAAGSAISQIDEGRSREAGSWGEAGADLTCRGDALSNRVESVAA